jgi:hypothetical protein
MTLCSVLVITRRRADATKMVQTSLPRLTISRLSFGPM